MLPPTSRSRRAATHGHGLVGLAHKRVKGHRNWLRVEGRQVPLLLFLGCVSMSVCVTCVFMARRVRAFVFRFQLRFDYARWLRLLNLAKKKKKKRKKAKWKRKKTPACVCEAESRCR